jgi:hypothetical protein
VHVTMRIHVHTYVALRLCALVLRYQHNLSLSYSCVSGHARDPSTHIDYCEHCYCHYSYDIIMIVFIVVSYDNTGQSARESAND